MPSIKEIEDQQKRNNGIIEDIQKLGGQINPLVFMELRLGILIEMVLGPVHEENESRLSYEYAYAKNLTGALLSLLNKVKAQKMQNGLVVPSATRLGDIHRKRK